MIVHYPQKFRMNEPIQKARSIVAREKVNAA